MKKFLVLYKTPVAIMQGWAKTDKETMKEEEAKMQKAWGEWMGKYKGMVKETAGAGKTLKVSKSGTESTPNDVMLYSMVEAESVEEAAKIFESHPHLGIPEATIEVMPANMLPGMKDM